MPVQKWFLNLNQTIGQALNRLYLPILQELMAEKGLQSTDLWLAQLALSAGTEPMTAVIILERAPYINEQLAQQNLAHAAERGLLTAVAPHSYHLTAKGRRLAHTISDLVCQAFQTIDPHIPPETNRLVQLLNGLVNASLQAAEPANKAALQRSRFYDPGPHAPILERLRRALNDLLAFRDDAHRASWLHHGISGPAWEAFSHIDGRFTYSPPVTTAAEIATKLTHRGYEATAYQQALQPLITRGWLTETDGLYRLTDKGKKARQTAETQTDRHFYAPWSLAEPELTELKGLMEKVNEALQPPTLEAIWLLAHHSRTHITQQYLPALQTAIAEAGLPPLGLFLLMQGQVVAPASLTADHILPIIPYTAESAIQARLDTLQQLGTLTADHQLTAKGQQLVHQLTQIVKDKIAAIPIPDDLAWQTAEYLKNLVAISHAAAKQTPKPALAHALFYAATPENSPLFHLLRAIAQLVAFRDDGHVAAWQTLAIPGYQWELFSHVLGINCWGQPIATATEAAEKFTMRGYDTAVYQAALQDCEQRGWLALNEADGRYTPTPAGQSLWQQIEERTDEHFYQPWQALSTLQRFHLHHLLTQLQTIISDGPS